ncbi:uncharacterized protein LOC120334271 [Styela clava]
MMHLSVIFLASLLITASLAFEHKCTLSEQVLQDFDIEKLNRTKWYTGLQTNDAAASDIDCESLRNFTETDYGFTATTRSYMTQSNQYVDWVSHFTRQRPGVYQESGEKDEPVMTTLYTREKNGNFNRAANKLVHKVILDNDFLFVTDHRNYIMTIFCSNDAQWVIWIFFPTPNPDLSNIAAAYNKMHRMGISAGFHASQCGAA